MSSSTLPPAIRLPREYALQSDIFGKYSTVMSESLQPSRFDAAADLLRLLALHGCLPFHGGRPWRGHASGMPHLEYSRKTSSTLTCVLGCVKGVRVADLTQLCRLSTSIPSTGVMEHFDVLGKFH